MYGSMWTYKSYLTGKLRVYSEYTWSHTIHSMIKTGDWTIADLVKYLVAVRHTLSQVEIDRLRQTSAFPKELTADAPNYEQEKAKRYKASELYEPLDSLRGLRLPIIDWGTHVRWRASSEEGNAHNILSSTFAHCSHSQVPIPSWVMSIPTSPRHSEASFRL